MALLADSPQFREGMVQVGHKHQKGRYATPIPSTINTKPQHFSLTLTSSPCLIMLPNTARSGAQTLGLHIPESIRQWLLSGAPRIYDRKDLDLPGKPPDSSSRPSLSDTFVVSLRSINSLPSLLPGMQKNDQELDAAATECRKMKRPKQTFARLSHPGRFQYDHQCPARSCPSGHYASTLTTHTGYLAVVVLLLQIVLVLLVCILARH